METIKLLEGVEILTVSESMPLSVCILLGFLCMVVIILSAYLLFLSINDGAAGGFIFSLIFIGVGIFLSALVIKEAIDPEITYKVTVSDSVSMNEFYAKYEVLDVDGKIYSIKERDVE